MKNCENLIQEQEVDINFLLTLTLELHFHNFVLNFQFSFNYILCDTFKEPTYSCTRSVRKLSGLPLYLRAVVFERPLRDMNANSKASRTYRLLADICRTYSSCAACFCLQSYF